MDDRQESRITNVNLGETMRKSFLEYAMSHGEGPSGWGQVDL